MRPDIVIIDLDGQTSRGRPRYVAVGMRLGEEAELHPVAHYGLPGGLLAAIACGCGIAADLGVDVAVADVIALTMAPEELARLVRLATMDGPGLDRLAADLGLYIKD